MSNAVSALAIAAKDDPAQLESLWLAVYRLIALWANKYHQTGESRLYDADDLLQAGYLALVDAIQGYDPERDAEFTSYLRYHCRRHFAAVAGIRTSKRYPENYAVSLNVPLDDTADITRLDTLEDPAADFEDDVIEKTFTQQAAAALLKEADKLDEQPRNALLLTAWDGLPLREAAEKMNLSIERVRQCREKAARKLRNTRTGRQIALEYYCHRHVSLSQFRVSHTSATEAVILWLEQLEEQRRFFAKVGGVQAVEKQSQNSRKTVAKTPQKHRKSNANNRCGHSAGNPAY